MKIVHFISGIDRGGAQRVVATLSTLQSEHHNVEIWLKCTKERSFSVPDSVRLTELSSSGCLSFLSSIRELRNRLSETKPDVLIAHTNRNTASAIIAGLLRGVPVIAVEHSVAEALQSRSLQVLRFILYPFARFVFVLSSDQMGKYPFSRTRIMPNPLPLRSLPDTISRVGRMHSEAVLRILFVGRLEWIKGCDRLLSILARTSVPFFLDIVGSGSLETKLFDQAKQLGIIQKVRFWGWQRDVNRFFRETDILTITSRLEGFGIVTIEAMAYGCIPIAYNVKGGLKDIIRDGIDGYLVSDGNVDEFVKRIEEVYYASDNIESVRKAARQRARQYLSGKIAEQWNRYLRRL